MIHDIIEVVCRERLDGRQRHAPPTNAVRRDDPICARQPEFLSGFDGISAGDYGEIGVDGLCGERNEHVAAVAAGSGDETASAFDPGFEESRIVGGISADGEETVLLRSGYGGFSAVNDDNVHVFSVNRGGGFTAHSAETTKCEMRFNRIDLLFHSSPPHEYSEYLVLYHGLHGHREYVEHQPDTAQHDEEVENATDR